MKLGEALVKEALITRQQLELALKRQTQFGGRIGTNLIESGFIEEEDLSKFLSTYFKVPSVKADQVNAIPEEVINTVSKEIIEKYRILPFRKERNRLHIAMLNPKDIKEIDELRFITGYDIIPYAITELRLIHTLEKYYGIKRDIRFISLTDRFTTENVKEEISIDNIKKAFTDVKDTEDVAGILLNEIFKIAPRIAIFTVKGEKLIGWKARGLDINNFVISENESPIFSEVIRTKTNYRGPIINIKQNESLIKILSGTPQDVLILPIAIREKVIAIVYIDNGNNAVLNANVGYISMLTSMAAIAFEILILKKRILDMGITK
ncbi:MAG: hypothetical protein HXY53_01820 [Nitrospirae bacterium]|nr:hypothetical protein [Nitrospirota bacterium]